MNMARPGDGEDVAGTEPIRVASWNVAGVNNNPFEYWVSTEDPDYIKLMFDVQSFMSSPQNDVIVRQVFTPAMFSSLRLEMEQAEVEHIEKIADIWENDYSQRNFISQFLLDEGIGMKRLSSMPDRVTNVVNLLDGSTLHRPSIITGFSESWDNMESWWRQWIDFMFHSEVVIACMLNTNVFH